MSRNSLIELLLLMSMFLCTTAIPLEDFYPYGPDVGDSQVNPAINHNGRISFGDVDVWVWLFGHIFYGANAIDVFIIPPNDIDNAGGAAWYRNSTSQSTNERALTDIQRVYPSVSYIDQILIATWDHLHLLSRNYQTNTFQAVIATSGNETYVMYLYADGLMQWISTIGGIIDYGGISTARVVYDSAIATFELPGSETCSIIHVTSRSNVDIPGMFVFDLDGTHPVFVSECEEGDVRLVDSNMNTNASGRVEMCLGSEWRVVGDVTWGVQEATVVCRQLGLPTDVVVVGWNLKSAGVPINCTGKESSLMDCSSEPGKRGNFSMPLRCSGGATTSTCLATDDCEDFLGQDSLTLPAVCFNRYGSCVPFSPYLLGSGGIPCDSVYESGTDYVYLKNSSESFQPLNVLGEIEQQLGDIFSNHNCTLSTVRMICHYYLPPCGNSTHFEPPTSVCSDACYQQSQICPFHWTFVESRLGQIESNPLNCSLSESVLNPIPHTSCSNPGVYTTFVEVALQEKEIIVIESIGEVRVCATIIDKERGVGCVIPQGFQIHISAEDNNTVFGADYTSLPTINFTDCRERACASIAIVDDAIAEDTESFTISLELRSNLTSQVKITPEIAVFTILDDDDVIVGFHPNVYSITEAEEQVTVCVEVLNSFNGKHLHSFSVVLLPTSVFQTSNAADDCYKELYFSTSESRKCHNYSVDNDNECQPTFFNIGLSIISTRGNRVQLQYNLSNATIFIDDSREPECYVTIGLSQTVYSVVEEQGVAVVCTSVLSGTTSGRMFSISYQTVDGDAKAPGDYMPTNGNFDITDSNPEQCTSIAIISDNTTEVGDECFNYTISTNSTIFGFTVDPSSATICISNLNEVTSSLPQAASSQTVVIVAAVLGTLILSVMVGFVAVTVIISAYRKRTKERRSLESTSAREPHYYSLSEGRRADFLQHLREQLENKKMIYSKDQIQLSTTVGQGESGLVYKGYIRTAVGSDIVAVKTGKALSSTRDLKTLAKEVSTMLSFEHENVMSLIGVCIDGEMPLIIMPFMSNGSVLDYLKNRKDNLLVTGHFLKEEVELACKTLLRICLHIAKGMEYLSGQKFVHRDLAARNCMINGEGVIKVADFGLTEDMYNTNYIRRRKKSETEEKVPIRWMAVESIENCIYTEASDVWSYGVTMWEIFTCGRVPYGGIHAMCLLTELKRGERLEKPDNKACHDDIFNVMVCCWKLESGERPKFSDLVVTVNDLLEQYAGYLELSRFPTLTVATTTSPPPSPADHPQIELTEMAVSEPDVAEKESDLRV